MSANDTNPQVVVSTVDIVSGNKQKTNVLTYIFRYRAAFVVLSILAT